MVKKLLIDAIHNEETRIAVIDDSILFDFESELSLKKSIRGNVYLAKVVRIEPSIQAAFINFGREKHGFLSFAEIHPDFYNNATKENSKKQKRFKIQDVIKKNQIILVQAIKEERGSKGAAFTTYITIAGRYCILMPKSESKGISRKITEDDRKRLKEIVSNLDVDDKYGIILRTASSERTKLEIKRDLNYLIKIWKSIVEKSKETSNVCMVYEEINLIKKAIRDIYSKDIEEIIVDGENAYKEAKSLMKTLSPGNLKKIKLHKEKNMPLFQAYQIEEQIYKISEPKVELKSGGTIIITQTEALVAIDVNSAKSLKEKSISETAFKTNLEAADEIARQIKLRDLAGIIVIDFIDMQDKNNVSIIEKRFKDAIKLDRARIQVGKISTFGLLELSRQRLRPSFQDSHTLTCKHCLGSGVLRSIESSALYILRQLELEVYKNPKWCEIKLIVPKETDLYLLNYKRSNIYYLEKKFNILIRVGRDTTLVLPGYRIEVSLEDDVDIVNIEHEPIETIDLIENDKKTTPEIIKPDIAKTEITEKEIIKKEEHSKKPLRKIKKEIPNVSMQDAVMRERIEDLPAANSNFDLKLISTNMKTTYHKKTMVKNKKD